MDHFQKAICRGKYCSFAVDMSSCLIGSELPGARLADMESSVSPDLEIGTGREMLISQVRARPITMKGHDRGLPASVNIPHRTERFG
jgi:hypothetical protein